MDHRSDRARGALIVAAGSDDLARRVVEQLRSRRLPVVWVDPDQTQLPEVSVQLVGGSAVGIVRAVDPGDDGDPRELALERMWRGWYHPSVAPGHLVAGQRLGAGWMLLEPLWMLLPRWLQKPSDLALASCRPVQLQRAQAAGLEIPATLLTTSPLEAQAFQQRVTSLIETPLTWPPTGPVGVPEELEHITQPRLLQADARGLARIRVTVVDDNVSAMRLETSPDGEQHPPVAVTVPYAIHSSIDDLLAALALRFAVLDFTEAHDGEWMFLGLDPAPHDAVEQAQVGLDVAALVAAALTDTEYER